MWHGVMHPVFFESGRLVIHSYGIMMALALVACVVVWDRLSRQRGRPDGYGSEIGVWLMVFALLGARASYVISNYAAYYKDHPEKILRFDEGGLIYYGGVIGGLFGLFLLSRWRRDQYGGLLDSVAAGLPLGHALGRVGCFLNGCCFGRPDDGFLAVRYPARTQPWYDHYDHGLLAADATQSLAVHPVQLYEAAFNVVLCVLLVRAHKRRTANGQIVAAYLMAYPAARFVLEFMRGDPRLLWGVLSVAQIISVALFGAGVCIWVWARRHPLVPS